MLFGIILIEEIIRSMYYMNQISSIKGTQVRKEFPTEYNNLIWLLFINTLVFFGYVVANLYLLMILGGLNEAKLPAFITMGVLDFIYIGFTLMMHIKSFGS